MKHLLTAITVCLALGVSAQSVQKLPYGDMNQWVTRNIKESGIIGGAHKQCFAIGPTRTIDGDEAYTNQGGSPWATSNVMAKVMGVTKVSNAVFPDDRNGGKCARLTTIIDSCRAIGLVDIRVLVAGTMFLGQMKEPIKSTKNPYSKMEMGMPFTGRPVALQYDYRVLVPRNARRIYQSGFGKGHEVAGSDKAEVFILLQRRWEDADGNIHARRVGTGREMMGRSSNGWVNAHRLPVHYGDITGESFYKSYMGLIPREKSYYAKNSRGKMVPVVEEGWDDADATPTHILVMFSAGSGEPYTGTPGLTLWVDNVALAYGPGGTDMARLDFNISQ